MSSHPVIRTLLHSQTFPVGMMFCLLVVALSCSVTVDSTPQFAPIPTSGFSTVSQGTFEAVLTKSGAIESAQSVTYLNECEYPTRIISLVESGTFVEAGDVIMELDSTGFRDFRAQREIMIANAEKEQQDALTSLEVQKLVNQSEVATADLEAHLAELDLRSYRDAEFPQTLHSLQNVAVLADETLNTAQQRYEFIDDMVRLGYRNPSELESQRIAVLKALQAFETANNNVELLITHTQPRTLTELEGLYRESLNHIERVDAVAEAAVLSRETNLHGKRQVVALHKDILSRVDRVISTCTIRATQPGEVIISTLHPHTQEQLHEGADVWHRLKLAYVLDRSQMQVKLRIHEAHIRFLKEGLPAEIVVEAIPGKKWRGHIESVSRLPLSGEWPNRELREYGVAVRIDAGEEEIRQLAPGMTAEVTLTTASIPNAFWIPLTSLVPVGQGHVAFVRQGEEVVPREVELGRVSEKEVQILSGLSAGEQIVTSPRIDCAERIVWLEHE